MSNLMFDTDDKGKLLSYAQREEIAHKRIADILSSNKKKSEIISYLRSIERDLLFNNDLIAKIYRNAIDKLEGEE